MNTFISLPEAAARAEVSWSTLREWCLRHQDLARKVEGRWRVDPNSLERILEGTRPVGSNR